ncbi:hypothetical protein [Paraburkholderia sacchari]|uniref:hypothetical protein n=1 Tax=Paraburkholderia sacchari TaxID=159450 RepID=UPI001BCFD3AD|nr:hypothetical protein [Paraburkholderia sacchari]
MILTDLTTRLRQVAQRACGDNAQRLSLNLYYRVAEALERGESASPVPDVYRRELARRARSVASAECATAQRRSLHILWVAADQLDAFESQLVPTDVSPAHAHRTFVIAGV